MPGKRIDFTATTTLLVPGSQHGLGTDNLVYQFWDTASPRRAFSAGSVTIDADTYDVLATFAAPQSGSLFLLTAESLIVAVPGSELANAYVDVPEATILLSERLNTEAWEAAPVEDQETALIWATQRLDELVSWYGSPTTVTQALAWPQTGQIDHLRRPVPIDVVPRVIKQATAFYALALLEEEATGGNVSAEANIKTKKIGDTSITYKDDAAVQVSVVQLLPSEIRTMLRFYGMVPGLGTVPVYRT